ncbi:MAG TPA: hypothetical protein VL737_04425 [Candidatus Pristimantibacillus sp.]|jgi:hypothetical protein|nr:hypothetical protein [Candidatus Pristimantibacillus sp.]
MKNRVMIAREVNVPELYFKNEGRLTAFPRRVELDGREYTFMDGLRYLVQKGQKLIQVFDMTDGNRDFRLQFDDGARSWTLVDMTV